MRRKKMNQCSECGGLELDYTISGVICRNCGLVLDDSPQEINPYSENHQTTGVISIAGTGMNDGKIVKSIWLLSNKEKNMLRASRIIKSIKGKLNLTETMVRQIEFLYSQTIDKKLSMGRSIEGILSACVYLVCLQNDIPKTMDEIVKARRIKKREFNISLKAVKEAFNINPERLSILDLLEKYLNVLNISFEGRTYAIDIYQKVKGQRIIQGKNPKSIVGAILYIADPNLTQRKIAHVLDIYETTIRKRYKEIKSKYY